VEIFKIMDLGMFDRFCPSLKTRAQLEERRCDMNRSRSSEGHVISMHRKKCWTNKWMQDPRKKFFQVHHCDPNAQYMKGWGLFKKKRGLTLCYSCKRLGCLTKECPGRGPIFLCCKSIGHEVLEFHRMISKEYSKEPERIRDYIIEDGRDIE
jgi:hypothetical protein